jgi:hypothetical protein
MTPHYRIFFQGLGFAFTQCFGLWMYMLAQVGTDGRDLPLPTTHRHICTCTHMFRGMHGHTRTHTGMLVSACTHTQPHAYTCVWPPFPAPVYGFRWGLRVSSFMYAWETVLIPASNICSELCGGQMAEGDILLGQDILPWLLFIFQIQLQELRLR